jgi:hypothetical protein
MPLKCRRFASCAFTILMLAAFSIPLIAFAPTLRAAVLYDSGDPTPAQQLVLEYINRARANPVAEGQRLGIDIHESLSDPSLVGPRPPLAMNRLLLGIAQAHTQNMYNLNYFSHNDPNGTTAFERIAHAGYNYVMAGENMAAGVSLSATELEDFMMADSGTPGRPHRVNLLDLVNPYPCGNPPCAYSEVGIGYYGAATPNSIGLSSLITEDFGTAANAGPFLLGVVYNDKNSNNFYDIGEGVAGVTITTSSGGYYAVSSSSGGYVIPIGAYGTITVTASGQGYSSITKTVTIQGTNVKLDFTSQTSTLTSSQSITQTSSMPITFQSTPSSFVGSITSATITACGNTFSSGQSTSKCGSSFTAIANLPAPATGWQFDHWTWAGGVTCSNNSVNPVSCSVFAPGGSLMAVYGAQVTFQTNPTSSALISWGSCSNPSQRSGFSFFSTSYGSATVTACYVPFGYALSNWSCSGGLACSGSSNSTMVTFIGPGTITLNLRTQAPTTSTSIGSTVTSSSTQALTATTSTTYTTPEFGFSQTVMIGSILAAFMILIKRKASRKK